MKTAISEMKKEIALYVHSAFLDRDYVTVQNPSKFHSFT